MKTQSKHCKQVWQLWKEFNGDDNLVWQEIAKTRYDRIWAKWITKLSKHGN